MSACSERAVEFIPSSLGATRISTESITRTGPTQCIIIMTEKLGFFHQYKHTPPFPIYTMLLVARSFKRQALRVRVGVKPVYSQPKRCFHRTLFRRSVTRPSRILCISAAGGGALTATLMLCWPEGDSPLKEPTPTPLSKLFTSYVVYSACSIPGLVEASPALLALCASIPGLRQLTEAFVRATFFRQVCFFVCMWMR